MADSLRLWVATPEKSLLDLPSVAWARILLADGGSIGIRPGHAPLLAETEPGPLHYGDGEGERAFDLERGILLVDHEGISVFTTGTPSEEERGMRQAGEDLRFLRLARDLLSALMPPGEGPVPGREEV